MLKAVVFDFDGVIADTEPLHLRAYQMLLEPEGITLTREDYYSRYLGFDDEDLFRAVARDQSVSVSDDRIDGWVEAKTRVIKQLLTTGSVLFPGAASCIRMLSAQFPLAVASGALEPEIRLVLETSRLLSCFTAISSASDGVRGKPAPDLYLLAVAKLGERQPIEPAACVALEDSRWGIEAAHRAGLRTVAVTHTYPSIDLPGAGLIVESLSDITIPKLQALWTTG
jgi:HAD superfamily hydrolase (TIGR01509 family)